MSEASNYRILKIPVNREKAVFYYYKPYVKDKESGMLEVPQDRSVYLCHFLRPIEEDFINKFFAQAGKIK